MSLYHITVYVCSAWMLGELKYWCICSLLATAVSVSWTHGVLQVICLCHGNHHLYLLKQYPRVTLVRYFIVTCLQVKDLWGEQSKSHDSHMTVT